MVTTQYLFFVCQVGAEETLKREIAHRLPELRFAFSRPGFVTFKLPEAVDVSVFELPQLTFARARGFSLGKVSGDSLLKLAQEAWQLPAVSELVAEGTPRLLQVWQRETQLPGDEGFEPGATPLTKAVRAGLCAVAPEGALDLSAKPRRGTIALDVTLVEPNEWWVGCHPAWARVGRWPGGVPKLSLPSHAVSRAYLKMKEALRWAALPASQGDLWIELGCAPGGASQALMDAGMYVLGVDPAEVDPVVVDDDRFAHLRMRSADVRRRVLNDARWLAADINAAPDYTLDAVQDVVTHAGAAIRGMLLTLKLPNWELAAPEKLAAYHQRIQAWGYHDVRFRQLAFNRREFCVAALRSRRQRRQKRR